MSGHAANAQDSFTLVKSRVVLSEYIGQFTKLKSMGDGRKFRGACPLHGGDNASAFSVDDAKGLWKCFAGCGGGSVFDFWMKQNDSDDIREALEAVSEQVGVQLPKRESDDGVSVARMKRALREVAVACNDLLLDADDPTSEPAWEYATEERGISDKVIDEWMIGFMPPGQEAVDFILDVCGDKQALIEAGVLNRSKSGGGYWSPFAGRLLFPVMDAKGAVVAFGGRAIPGVDSFGDKFVNPHESRVYSKSKILYGMHLLSERPSRVIVGEGYLDAIAVRASKARDTVGLATCGTSLTTGHVEILARYDEVIFMFDGDDAGRKALAGSYWAANKLGDTAKGQLLEGGKDPWDMYQESPRDLRKMLETAGGDLLTMAVEAKHAMATSDSDFDQWVASAVASLVRTDHKDIVLRSASRIRKQPTQAYARGLSAGRARTVDEATKASVALDPNMKSLVRRMLQMTDDERDAVFASMTRWTDNVESAVRSWFPVSSEVDVDVLCTLVAGPVYSDSSSEVDRAIAECLPEPDSEPEDIAIPLRNLINILTTDAEQVCGVPDTPTLLTKQVLGLRRINGTHKVVEAQTEVLAYIVDLAMDMGRWRALSEDRARD